MTFDRFVMGVSYAKIICHLDMLKHERRMTNNLRAHPYKEADKVNVEKVDVKEIVTRQMLDRSQQNLQVTYILEKPAGESKKSDEILQVKLFDDINGARLCSSLQIVYQRNEKIRRFSEFDAFRKVLH
jgi:hypothetical protein